MKEVPKYLLEKWSEFWDKYEKKDLDENKIELLHDLCFWESMKEKLKKDCEVHGEFYVSEKGYSQKSACFLNLMGCQDKTDKLREVIYGKTSVKKEERQEKKQEPKLRQLK